MYSVIITVLYDNMSTKMNTSESHCTYMVQKYSHPSHLSPDLRFYHHDRADYVLQLDE
jgi:hypothetical protein